MARTMKDRMAIRTSHANKNNHMKKPSSAPVTPSTSSPFSNKKKQVPHPIIKQISKPAGKVSIWSKTNTQPTPRIPSPPASPTVNSSRITTRKSANNSQQISQEPTSKPSRRSKKVTPLISSTQRSKALRQKPKKSSRKTSSDSLDIEINSPINTQNHSTSRPSTKNNHKTISPTKPSNQEKKSDQHHQKQPKPITEFKQKARLLRKDKLNKINTPAITSTFTQIELQNTSDHRKLNQQKKKQSYKKLLRSGNDFGIVESSKSRIISSTALRNSPNKSPPASPHPKRKTIAKPSKNKQSLTQQRSTPQKQQQQKRQQQVHSPPKKSSNRRIRDLTSGNQSETSCDTSMQSFQQTPLVFRGIKSNRVINDEDESNSSTAKKRTSQRRATAAIETKEEKLEEELESNEQQQQHESSSFSQKIKQKIAAVFSLIPPNVSPTTFSSSAYKSFPSLRDQSDSTFNINSLFQENKNNVHNSKKLGLTELFPITESYPIPTATTITTNTGPLLQLSHLPKKQEQNHPSHLRFFKEQVSEQVESKGSSKREIDIVFCCDTTSSMGDYLHATIDQIAAIYKKVQPFSQIIDVKYGFVCYRDHHPEESTYLYRISNLGSPLQTIQFIQKQEAAGGGDTPEAVMDGLYVATAGMNWRTHSRKYIIHIADAPPHGDIYTGVKGGFLQRSFLWHDGCPCGLSIEKIARIMNSLQIHYRLIRAGDNMSRMAAIFKSCIQHYADMKVTSPKGLDFILSDMIAKQCLTKEDISDDFTSNQLTSYLKKEKNILQQYQQEKKKPHNNNNNNNNNISNNERSVQSQKAMQFEKLLLKKYEEVLAAKNAYMEQLDQKHNQQQKQHNQEENEDEMMGISRNTRNKRKRSTSQQFYDASNNNSEQGEFNFKRNNIFEDNSNNNRKKSSQESGFEMKLVNSRRSRILF